MDHKWLFRRGIGKILAGLILVFVLGPNACMYVSKHEKN